MKKTFSLLLSFILCISLFPAFVQPTYAANGSEPQVHVMLKNYLGNKTQIIITPSGTYKTTDGKISLNNTTTYTIKIEQAKLKLYKGNTFLYEDDSLTFTPSNPDDYLTINNRKYKGSFTFMMETINGSNYIRPVNTLGIEEYLKGVVPSEMPASWNLEALKAQAVAARTYSWNYGGKTITDTISHQVYGGLNNSHPNSDQAVEATIGQVLKFNNRLIDAVFSASNGGVMDSAKNVWGNDFAYLVYAQDSFDTSYTWSFNVQKTQINMQDYDVANPDIWWNKVSEKDSTITTNIKKWLNDNGYKDKDIKIVAVPTLSFDNPSTTKRVSTGSISIQFYVKNQRDSNGELLLQEIKQANVAASKVRAMIGINDVKSYLITKSSSTADTHSIAGRGYGHGVGLSQYGANNRASVGQKYNTILAFYYPETQLVTEYSKTAAITVPELKEGKAEFNQANNTVKVGFTLTKAASTVVTIKDNDGNSIATLLNNGALQAGSYDYTTNASSWNNGSYTAEITATDIANNKVTTNIAFQVAKIEVPTISSIKTAYDAKANTINSSFAVKQSSKVTVTISDSKNKVMKTLASNKSQSAGTSFYKWDVRSVKDGTYTLTVKAVNSIGEEKTGKQNFTLKKAVAPTIKDIKASYDTASNKIKTSFYINQSATTTVKILNSKGKVVKTLASNKSLKTGTHSFTWSVGKAEDGSYTVSVESVNGSKQKSTVTKKFTLYKVKTGTVKASNLNIRQKASTSSKKVGSIPNNKKVTIYAKSGSWYKIKYGKVTGYVSAQYVKNVK
ncbi:SpoIID/LytB domain-containing protein [Niallia circulans]